MSWNVLEFHFRDLAVPRSFLESWSLLHSIGSGLSDLYPHSCHEKVVGAWYVLLVFGLYHFDSDPSDLFKSDLKLFDFVNHSPCHGNLSSCEHTVCFLGGLVLFLSIDHAFDA